MTPRKSANAPSIQENLGRYDASRAISTIHTPKRISTMTRKKYAFPVIYGKNIEVETTSGVNGRR